MAVATAVIMVGVVVVAVGRGGEMAYFSSDYAPLDLGAVAPTDVVLLRPPTSIWGYNIQVTDEAFSRIAQAMSTRDIRIASLEQQVADLRAEWDMQTTSPGAPPADVRAARWEARAAGWDPAGSLRPAGKEGLTGRKAVSATRPHPGGGTAGPGESADRSAATSPVEATSPLGAAPSGEAPSQEKGPAGQEKGPAGTPSGDSAAESGSGGQSPGTGENAAGSEPGGKAAPGAGEDAAGSGD